MEPELHAPTEERKDFGRTAGALWPTEMTGEGADVLGGRTLTPAAACVAAYTPHWMVFATELTPGKR